MVVAIYASSLARCGVAWFSYCAFWGPTQLDSLPQCLVRYDASLVFNPFGDALRFAESAQEHVCPSVSVVIFLRYKSAVSRLVIPVVVNAV